MPDPLLIFSWSWYTQSLIHPLANIPGYSDLEQFWGNGFPSFHDSEILNIHLERSGVSSLSLRLVGRRREKNPEGAEQWVPITGVTVRFLVEGIEDLELTGFSAQNVISGLTVQNSGSGYRLEIHPCYGVSGWIHAEQLHIEFSAIRSEE